MPYAQRDDAKVHYESTGSGPSLTLVMGLGGAGNWWFAQVPELSKHFRVVTLDNRGTGTTESETTNLTMDIMADDVAAVLDAAGIEHTHLLGISMGGMISQHVALRYPGRIDKLILCCTTAGGMTAVQPPPEVVEQLTAIAAPGGDPLQAMLQVATVVFSEEYRSTRIHELVSAMIENQIVPPSQATLANQIGAVMMHDTYDRLGEIAAPTLVMTGDADILIPPENSKILAEQIPQAELRLFPGCGHGFNLEAADQFNRAVEAFLS